MSAAVEFDNRVESSPVQAPVRSLDPFRVLRAEERTAQLAGYLTYLKRRDGEMDFSRGTLANRERYFAELEKSVFTWEGEADVDGFYQHHHRVGTPEIDARTTWLVAAARANQQESYAVEGELDKWRRKGTDGESEILLHDLLQERYHTRILHEICQSTGLGSVRPQRPDTMIRAAIFVMQHFPDSLRYIAITCGEVVGCVVFQTLLETCDLFADDPEVETRLRSLLGEILEDELGHVLYCRARMSPLTLGIAKRLLPWFSRCLLRNVPELRVLGLDQTKLLQMAAQGVPIPESFDWLAPDPA